MKKLQIVTCIGSRLIFVKDLETNKEISLKESASYVWDKIISEAKPEYKGLTEDLFPTFTCEVEEEVYTRITFYRE